MAAIPQPPSPNTPWLLTGDDPQALRRNAALLRDHLDAHPGLNPGDIGISLADRARKHHRAAVLGANPAELRDAVAAMAAGEPSQSIVTGMVRGDDRPVLVFPGQGWQWVGMAEELRHASPAFAERLAECDAALSRYLPVSVIDAMTGDGLDDVELMQPALWAVMVSLARQWESVGITPAAVLGHSQGETAAAVVAGALSVADGARIVTAYARAIKRGLSGHGGMVSVGLPADRTETLIQPWRDRVWVGVLNGPSVTLVTGDPDALTEVLSACQAQDVWARRINMDYAPHCPMVDPVVDELRDAFAGIEARPCRIPFYSTVTGGRVDATALDAEYWVANLRSPIRFVDALRSMVADGYRVFAESSAHPVLGVGMQETFDEAGVGAESVALGTLRRDDGGPQRFLTSRAQLWANGVGVDWDADFPGANPVELPAEAEASSETDNPFADLTGLGLDQQRLRMADLVRSHAAAVLGVAVGEVAVDVPFRDAGFDSAKAVELRTALNGATGLNLPAAVVYSCPTPADLAERMRRDLLGETDAVAAPVAEVIDPDDPIAIVGMACRFPGGVRSPEDLWRIVADGVDAMGEFPTDRGWNLDELYDPEGERRGSSYVREGAFLYDAADFDAEFFGISPREALSMEPQQRLTLEVAWEALERAGIDPSTLRGTNTGVYIGASAQEYGSRLDQAPEGFEGQMLTGTTNSVVSGRVSYTFGLEGPALTVDTACSASLVSLHLAAQGLRQGDCSIAIVGGVTVMARPGMFVELSRQRGLAADGRCKAFSAAADGTNWAEGVGMLVVERLSDAKRLGHKVLAVVRGSAINQDGASNGLSAPSGPAQERVIRHALATAGLTSADVDAVEAHGTGTKLGDPIEAQAILATYGQGRDASEPVYLGSLKSNIGHAQTTAGVGGVIKMVMSLRHGQLPKTLHIDEPTPHVDWSSGAVALLREPVAWPDRGRPRRAAVSSFGISGTNAHVILEHEPEAAEPDHDAPGDAAPTVWHLSGRTPQALAAQAERLAAHVREHPVLDIVDIAHSLVTTRTALRTRAAVVGSAREELLAGIDAIAAEADEPEGDVVRGTARAHGVGPVFVFPGQGAQWVGMGIELAQEFPVFAEAMDECAAALRPFTGRDLWEDLRGDIGPIEVVQPLLWAVMVSLAKLWRSFGVEPSAVVGHSQGEVAAAVVSGALSLSDGAKVIALRSSLLARRLSNIGSIVSVALPVDEVRQRIADLDGLGIAAVNGPSATVVVGDNAELDALVAACETDGVRARRIPSGYPTHSARVDPLREELSKLLGDLRPRRGAVPMWSTVTGEPVSGEDLDEDYWFRNMRHTVQLEPVVRSLASSGYLAYIEMSPHPVLASAIQDIGEHADLDVYATGSLRRDDGGARRFLISLADAHVNGLSVDWSVRFGDRRAVDLPTYAFQHRRYWLSTPSGAATDAHPLSVVATPLAETDGAVLTATLSRANTEWLADHAVDGRVLLSGTAFVELVTTAGEAVGHGRLAELTLRAPLELESREQVRVQVTVGAPTDGNRPVAMYSRPEGSPEWVLHAEGTLAPPQAPDAEDNAFGLAPWPPADADPVDVDHFYATIAEWGYGYGPSYRGITAAWCRGDEVFTEVRLGDDHQSDAAHFGVHPGLLDAALHGFLIERMSRGETGLALPFAITGVDVFTPGVSAARVSLTRRSDDTVAVRIADATGTPVARLESFLPRAAAAQSVNDLYTVAWGPVADATVSDEAVRVTALADLPRPVPPVVVVPALDDVTDVVAAVTRAHDLARSWLAEPDCDGSTLVFDVSGDDPVHAAVAGYLRSARTEHPGRFGIVHSGGENAAVPAGEPESRRGADGIEAPLLRRLRGAEPVARQWNPDRPVWITGGTGTLGTVLARHLVTVHGVRRLLLTSRRGLDAPDAAALQKELTDAGADVAIRACDVTDRDAVAALIADADPGAVIHAAGVLDDGAIENLTPEQLRRVLSAKAVSAGILDELTAGVDLDAFVLFSSIAGVIGSGGQANYAAANAYLDALARDRRRRGLPGVSMAWGLWDIDSGMTGHLSGRARDRLARVGVAPIPTEAGLSMFDAALRSDEPVVVAARLDLAALRDQAAVGELLPLYRGLITVPKRPAVSQVPLDQRLAEVPPAERGRVLLEVVRSNAAAVLRSDVAEIAPNLAFRDAGFDSLTAVELRNRLNRLTGLRLPSTVVFRHPTPAELAERLLSELVIDAEPAFLADVDRLRDNLSGLDAADEHRAEAVTRLRALLRELDGPASDDDLDTATEEEMFALIDRELGLD